MISHDQAQMLASERLDAPLSSQDAEALATHLLTCADCRSFARQLEAISVGIRALPHLPASPAVTREVTETIAGERPRWGWLERGLTLASSPALAIASGILLFFAVASAVYIAMNPGQTPLIAMDLPGATATPENWAPAKEATSESTVLAAPTESALIASSPTVVPQPTSTPAAAVDATSVPEVAIAPTKIPAVTESTTPAESNLPTTDEISRPGAGTSEVQGSEPVTTRSRSRGNDGTSQPEETPVVAAESPAPSATETGNVVAERRASDVPSTAAPDAQVPDASATSGDAVGAEPTIAGRAADAQPEQPTIEAALPTEEPAAADSAIADAVEPTIEPTVSMEPTVAAAPTEAPIVVVQSETPTPMGGIDLPEGALAWANVLGLGQVWVDPTVSDYGTEMFVAADDAGNSSAAIADATGSPVILDPTAEVHSDIILGWMGDLAYFQRAYPDGRLELRAASPSGDGYAVWSGADGGLFNTGVSDVRIVGDRIAYLSGGQVFVAPVSDPNNAIGLSTTPVVGFDISPDGSKVAISNGWGIAIYPMGASDPFAVFGNEGGIAIGTVDWTPDGILLSLPTTGEIALLPNP